MIDITIITNNVPRFALDWADLTERERAEFDYVDDPEESGTYRFVRYRGVTYDLHEFQSPWGMPESSPLHDWDGFQPDSFFSGVLVRYCLDADYDYVVMGHYYC